MQSSLELSTSFMLLLWISFDRRLKESMPYTFWTELEHEPSDIGTSSFSLGLRTIFKICLKRPEEATKTSLLLFWEFSPPKAIESILE